MTKIRQVVTNIIPVHAIQLTYQNNLHVKKHCEKYKHIKKNLTKDFRKEKEKFMHVFEQANYKCGIVHANLLSLKQEIFMQENISLVKHYDNMQLQ